VKSPETKTFYVSKDDLPQYNLFYMNSKTQGKSLSHYIMELITQENARLSGSTIVAPFDFEALKTSRLKWKKTELNLMKLLQDESSENDLNAYEAMIGFAVELGSDECLEKNIEDVLKQLHNYKHDKSDVFSQSTLETFCEYVECVLKRRELECQIRNHRRKQYDSKNE
jgi:hypothetical protein